MGAPFRVQEKDNESDHGYTRHISSTGQNAIRNAQVLRDIRERDTRSSSNRARPAQGEQASPSPSRSGLAIHVTRNSAHMSLIINPFMAALRAGSAQQPFAVAFSFAPAQDMS